MTKKPDYKKALQGVLAILETEPEPTDNSSKSSETDKGIQDITQESSEIAYQFTDHDLTVYKNSPDEHDTDEKVK